MAPFEYRCQNCGKIFDVFFKIGKAASEVQCNDCGGVAKRTFSYAGFILKGPGDHWPSQQLKRKRQMTKNNEEAGKRGYKKWKERTPKLVRG